MKHAHSFRLQTDLTQDFLNPLYPAACVGITFQVMAVALQSAGYQYAVGAVLKSTQGHQNIQFPGTWKLYDLDCRGILESQSSRQVCSCIGAVFTTISDNLE